MMVLRVFWSSGVLFVCCLARSISRLYLSGVADAVIVADAAVVVVDVDAADGAVDTHDENEADGLADAAVVVVDVDAAVDTHDENEADGLADSAVRALRECFSLRNCIFAHNKILL